MIILLLPSRSTYDSSKGIMICFAYERFIGLILYFHCCEYYEGMLYFFSYGCEGKAVFEFPMIVRAW